MTDVEVKAFCDEEYFYIKIFDKQTRKLLADMKLTANDEEMNLIALAFIKLYESLGRFKLAETLKKAFKLFDELGD